jgi:hypothetical protein
VNSSPTQGLAHPQVTCHALSADGRLGEDVLPACLSLRAAAGQRTVAAIGSPSVEVRRACERHDKRRFE